MTSVRRSGVHSSIRAVRVCADVEVEGAGELFGDVEGGSDAGAPDLDTNPFNGPLVSALARGDRVRQTCQCALVRPGGDTVGLILQRPWDGNLLGAFGRLDIKPYPAGWHRIHGREHAEPATFPRAEPGRAGENHLRERDDAKQRGGAEDGDTPAQDASNLPKWGRGAVPQTNLCQPLSLRERGLG